jgi:D-sedoheptulose 7-phosphate isomerase
MKTVVDYLVASREALQAAIEDEVFCRTVAQVVERVARALSEGGKLLLAGNGGSAADAQHLAAELVGRLNYERAPAAAIALTTDSSVLTALANDYGYDRVFERQIRALGRRGDVFLALSTSGRSPNILRALAAAREVGLATIGLTGKSGGEMAALCDLCLQAPAEAPSLVQQLHIAAGHMICGLVEQQLFSRTYR